MRKFLYLSVSFSLFLFIIFAGTLRAQATVIQEWDFETALGDWASGNGGATIALSTEQAAGGTQSAKLVKANNHLEINLQNDVYEDIQEGDVIKYKVWVSSADLADINGLQVFWHAPEWAWNAQWFNGSTLVADQWTTIEFTMPALGTPVNRIGLQILAKAGNEAKTPTVYIDDVSVSRVESSNGLITVDGDKDDFFEALTGPDDGYLQIRSYANSDNGRPKSDEDLSAKIWTAWDPDWLYLYAEVMDDTISAGTTSNVWEVDNMELKFDAQPKDSVTNSIWDTRLTAPYVRTSATTPTDSLNNIADSLKQWARKPIDGGYALELAIKWAGFGGSEDVSVAVDSVFGLGINFHDNDGRARQASIIWAARMLDAIWNTPKYLGTVKFLADNKLQFIPTNNVTGVTNPTPYDGSDYFAITVDGQRDGFYTTLNGPDNGYLQIKSYAHSDNGRPKNDADLSSQLWGAWDADWLYLYAEVRDDTVSAGTTSNVWETDNMELKFDLQPTDSVANSIWDTRLTAPYVRTAASTPTDSLNNVADSLKQWSRRTMTGGYALELAIKWSAIGSTEHVSPAVDSIFGLGVNFHDNDGRARQSSIIWAARMLDAIWNTPKYLGTVKLLADNKIQFIPTNNMTGVTNPTPYDGSNYFVPIVVDAQRDGFYSTLTGPNDGYLQIRSFAHSDNGAPASDADLSGQIWTAWDENWLYLYTEVRDDTISAGTTGNVWEVDNMELKFDAQAKDSVANSIWDTRLTAPYVRTSATTPTDSLNNVADSLKQWARRTMTGGYAMELAINWSVIGGTTEDVSVAVDSVFGLGINLHDNDGAARQASIIWAAFNLDAIWNTPKYLGTVKFLANNKLEFVPENNMTGRTNHNYPYDGSDLPDGVESTTEIPMVYALSQNYPNPFNPTTTINFSLPQNSDISLVVYDVLGRKVQELASGNFNAGQHKVTFNASNLATGVYFYRLEAGSFVDVKKLILMK